MRPCCDLGVARPRIAVAALNPHAGEGGLFGRQDIDVSEPDHRRRRCRTGCDVFGPVPGDTVFVKLRAGQYDAVVAMYHDQGHIPVKLLGFEVDPATGEWDGAVGRQHHARPADHPHLGRPRHRLRHRRQGHRQRAQPDRGDRVRRAPVRRRQPRLTPDLRKRKGRRPMPDLASPIELLRPPSIEFGSGTVAAVGRWAAAKGVRRTLVVVGRLQRRRASMCSACPARWWSSAR